MNVLKDFLANLQPHIPARDLLFSPAPALSKKRKGPEPDPDQDSKRFEYQRLGM